MAKTTPKQKKAIDNILTQWLTGKVNRGKALIDAWFSKQVARTPLKVLNSAWAREYLEQAWLTEANFALYLAEDIQCKPANRLWELRLLADILGLTKQTVDINVQKTDEAVQMLKWIIDWEVIYSEDWWLNDIKNEIDE